MSTYKKPDISELNYHAGTALRYITSLTSIKIVYLGVQFAEGNEDALLAALLLHMCAKPECDITTVRCNVSSVLQSIHTFVHKSMVDITFSYTDQCFTANKEEQVPLICICRSPWIEGTTSKAIYGEKQRFFNCHAFCRCGNWFHVFCLSKCKITPPKRTHDFLCPFCQIPPTVPWTHPVYTNTCTSDNFLMIVLLTCLQVESFFENIGTNAAECAMKAAISQMMKGKLEEGKSTILDYIGVQISNNCWGSEFCQCLTVFHDVWKLRLSLQCTSASCSNLIMKDRFPTSFSLYSPTRTGKSFS